MSVHALLTISASCSFFFIFFFNDTATTEIYTLSLHDALPILDALPPGERPMRQGLRESRAHEAVGVGRVDEHADGQCGHGGVAHPDPGRASPPDREHPGGPAEGDQPPPGAGAHDPGPGRAAAG